MLHLRQNLLMSVTAYGSRQASNAARIATGALASVTGVE